MWNLIGKSCGSQWPASRYLFDVVDHTNEVAEIRFSVFPWQETHVAETQQDVAEHDDVAETQQDVVELCGVAETQQDVVEHCGGIKFWG